MQPNEQTKVGKGPWYQYQYQDAAGVILNCYLECSEGYPDTRDEPGESAKIELSYALCNGVDIAELLSEDVVSLIESEAESSMEMDMWNQEYDRGADQAMDRELELS